HAFAHALEHGFQLRGLLTRQLDITELALAEQGDLARLALIRHDDKFVTRLRDVCQALNFHRNGWPGLADALPLIAGHGTDPAEACAHQHDVTTLERAPLHENGRYRTATLVEPGFND